MKYLSGCFGLLTVLSIVWIMGGVLFTMTIPAGVSQIAATQSRVQPPRTANERAANDAATGITSLIGIGLSLPFFLCTGIPAALFSLLLTAITYQMYTSERRHQEAMQAQYAQNQVLGTMAASQLARNYKADPRNESPFEYQRRISEERTKRMK